MRFDVLDPQRNLPFRVEPESPAEAGLEGLLAAYEENRDFLEDRLLEHGAILFRGFGVADPEALDRFVRLAGGAPLDYVDGTTPRTRVADGVYTSTEFPARYPISMHNELSYSERWPARLFFCCATPPGSGGETPLADSRAVLRGMDPSVADEFERRQVKYIRNLHGGKGFGLSWQAAFETRDRDRVEEILRGTSAEIEWTGQGGLRLSHVRPAVAAHPRTGERVWFNQAEQFHPSAQARDIYQSMLMIYKREDHFPQNACFGDGAPIPAGMLEEVRRTCERERVLFPWQAGDLVMIDNVLACHGRMPYAGPRKILAAMTS